MRPRIVRDIASTPSLMDRRSVVREILSSCAAARSPTRPHNSRMLHVQAVSALIDAVFNFGVVIIIAEKMSAAPIYSTLCRCGRNSVAMTCRRSVRPRSR